MSISGPHQHEPDYEPGDVHDRPRPTTTDPSSALGTAVATESASESATESGGEVATRSSTSASGDIGPGVAIETITASDAVAAAGTIRAVERAIAVLCAFSRETPSLGVTELAERLELTKSSVHRVLQVLMAHGLVAQDPIRRHYSLGYRILALAQAVPGEADLRHICQPHMRALLTATRETVALYVAGGDVRVCLEELESPQMLRMCAGVGRCFPLDRGAASYALLIDGPDAGESWQRVTAMLSPERVAELRERVRAARAVGYARSGGETVSGAASIAAPIRNPDGLVVAALSVGAPATRLTDDAAAQHTGALLDAVARIERDLAATWSHSPPPGGGGRAKGGVEGRR